MKAYVINLDRAPDRWDFAQTQGSRLNLDLARLAATEGAQIPEAEYHRLCPTDPRGRRITRSELACFLSHTRAWAEIAAGTASHGVVFEDDVLLADDAAAYLAPDWLPGDADLVKLNASKRRVKINQTALSAPNGRALHRLVAPTIDASAYVISARHARELLATTTTFPRAADRAIFDTATGAIIYQLNPGVAVQQKFTQTEFLNERARASQIQTDRSRQSLEISFSKLGQELRNLYRKEIFPRILPVLTRVTPKANRIYYIPVPFAKGSAHD